MLDYSYGEFFYKIQNGDFSHFIDRSERAIKRVDCDGNGVLHVACSGDSKGNLCIVKHIVKEGIQEVDITNHHMQTPLHIAAMGGSEKVVKQLIWLGASVTAKDYYDITPLHIAADVGNQKVIRMLIKAGADIEAMNDHGETPLSLCRSEEVKKVMLETRDYFEKKQNLVVANDQQENDQPVSQEEKENTIKDFLTEVLDEEFLALIAEKLSFFKEQLIAKKHKEKAENLLNTLIEDLEISYEAKNHLSSEGINTIRDLVQKEEYELNLDYEDEIKQEINITLAKSGLTLGMNLSEIEWVYLSRKKSSLEEKLNWPIESLDLSVRASNCLASEGIMTIKDLVSKEESEFLKIRNFGKTSTNEIKEKLTQIGLDLGMTVEDY